MQFGENLFRMRGNIKLMIVAGEPSGDAHAAALVHALREAAKDVQLELFGATGSAMRSAGVESIFATDDLAIMGILEVTRVLPRFLSAFRELKRTAFERKPDAVVLVDWPEFNLRLAKTLHRRGLRVIYYISPQVWAWRSHRVRNIRRDVDLLLSILPFESEWFAKRGVTHVEYVGHPLVGEVHARYGREEFCRLHNLDPARPIIALLPGSRHKELVRILPPMLSATAAIARERSDVQFALVVAPSRSPEEAKQIIAGRNQDLVLPAALRIIHHGTREALAAADVAAVASGTATLEAAILGTPMVIVYKESPINWHTLGRLITADHYGLVNLIAGERIVTELMQNDLNGQRLASELAGLLGKERNQAIRSQLREIGSRLGEVGASGRAAIAILNALERKEALGRIRDKR
jgi:lipid-A-disaccharide synthase